MSAQPVLVEPLRDALRDCFVEGYLLAVEHARQHLKLAGIAGFDPVLDALPAIAAQVQTAAAIAKATGSAS